MANAFVQLNFYTYKLKSHTNSLLGDFYMNVCIMDGCVGCGACEAINSDVFFVDVVAHVNEGSVEGNEQDCIDAALVCPVNAIWVEDI